MNLIDANVLLYSVDRGAAHHAVAREWLDHALSGRETVLLPWICLLAFLRLSTQPRVYEKPLGVDQALDTVDLWLGQPNVTVPTPDKGHVRRMRELLAGVGRGGNLINDAYLAALAIQHDAIIVTFDVDFARFDGVRWTRPLAGP